MLEAYDALSELVIPAVTPPAKGWDARERACRIQERLWWALETLATVHPSWLSGSKRRRIADERNR